MPRQSLAAMKVAFGIRAQSATLALLITMLATQVLGVLIFSGNATAIGTVSYSNSITAGFGGGFNDSAAVAVARDNSYYVVSRTDAKIHRYNSAGTAIGSWGSSGSGDGQFLFPTSVALNLAGEVYVLDPGNNRVQKFAADGTFISKWGAAGSADGQFNTPSSVSIDSLGYVYVADTNNARIQKFDQDGAFVTKWGSSGSGNTQFSGVTGVAADSKGNVYTVERSGQRVKKYDRNGTYVSQWGSSGTADGQFQNPYAIAVDSRGYVYVGQGVYGGEPRIQKFDQDGAFIVKWGSAGSGSGQFDFDDGGNYDHSIGLSAGPAGKVYVADVGNNRVQVFNDSSFDLRVTTLPAEYISAYGASVFAATSDTASQLGASYSFEYGTDTDYGSEAMVHNAPNYNYVSRYGVAGSGSDPGQFGSITKQIAVDVQGTSYITDTSNCRIQKFDAAGTFVAQWGTCGSSVGQLNSPMGVAVDSLGNVYVADYGNLRIQKFDADGSNPQIWVSIGVDVGSIAIDSQDNVYVGSTYGNWVRKYNSGASLVTQWGGAGTGPGQFSAPGGIAIDSLDNVYTIESGYGTNNRVQKFTSDGTFITQWGSDGTGDGQFTMPYSGIAIDKNDYVYVPDNSGNGGNVFTSSGTFVRKGYLSRHLGPKNDNTFLAVSDPLDGGSSGRLGVVANTVTTSLGSNLQMFSYLNCETTYHYRVKAEVGAETVYGQDRTFTTASCADPMTITTTSLEDALKGSAYSQTVEVANAAGAVTYGVAGGEIPVGLTLNTSTGEISGTPTTTSSYTAQFTVWADDGTTYVEQPLEIYVVGFQSIAIIDNINPIMTIGEEYDHTVSTEDGFGVPVFTLASGSLPAGISMDSTGYITGTPTTEGVYNYTIQVTDLSGTDSHDYQATVYDTSKVPENSPIITISSPAVNTTLEQDDVVITGTGPANSTLSLWVDSYQAATVTTDGSGDWLYHLENIFPGSHQFEAKYQSQASLLLVPTTYTFDAPFQTTINLVDTATDKIIKRYYTGADYPYSYDSVVSKATNKTYVIVPDGQQFGLMQIDLASGSKNIVADNFDGGLLAPPLIAIGPDDQTVYVVTDDELIAFNSVTQNLSRQPLVDPLYLSSDWFPRGVINAEGTKLFAGYNHYDLGGPYVFGRAIAILDLQTREVTQLDLGAANLKESFTSAERIGNLIYITYADGRIVVMDSTTEQIVKTIDMQLSDPFPSFGEYERVLFSAIDATSNTLYTTVNKTDQDYIDIRAVNLETDQVTTLYTSQDTSEVYSLPAFDPATSDLYVFGANYGQNQLALNRFNLQNNGYYSGPGYPIIDEAPALAAFGYNNKSIYQQAQPFVASTSFNLPLPEPEVESPEEEQSEEIVDANTEPQEEGQSEDTAGDEEQASVGQPADTTRRNNNAIANRRNPIAGQSSLLAFVGRIPEPVAVGLPWTLLTLALVLVGSQYYQVRSESAATRRIQASVERQERLVDEQNNFVALSTHYLHTPLTVMEGEITLMVRAGTLTQAEATKLKATLSSLNSEAETVLAQEENL